MIRQFTADHLLIYNDNEDLEIEFFPDGIMKVWNYDSQRAISIILTKEEMLQIANQLSAWALVNSQQTIGEGE